MSPDTLNHALTMWDVAGDLDTEVMAATFRHVLGEAEVLRVTFVEGHGDGELRLAARGLGDWQPFFLDLRDREDPEQAAREALADLVRRPFDMERDLLIRLGAVRLAEDRSLVVIAYHHLISDGYGAGGLLSRRLAEVYSALAQGAPVPDLPHPWDLESFAAEATEYRRSARFTEDTAFWGEYLSGAPAPAQVPRVELGEAARAALAEPMGDLDRWSDVAGAIGMVSRTLTVPRAETDRWTETAKSLGVWMSSLLTSAAAVFFRHRCDQPEFLLSLAVGNRVGVASRTPGLAVNVVPVRVRAPLSATFAEIADAMVDETYEIFDHTACHYSDIQRASDTALSGRGSFGAVLNVVEFVEQLHFDGHPARYLGATTGSFDELSIGVYTDGTADSDLFVRLDAPAGLYSREELRVVGSDLIEHIRAVTADPQRPIGALDTLGGIPGERVATAPDETASARRGATVAELFARTVEKDPEAVAVEAGDAAVSFRELDALSTHLAETLRRRHIGPESVVAVALPRSVDLIVALLGVVKAGGAYLPIDPASPSGAVASLAAESAASALLTDTAGAGLLSGLADVSVLLWEDLRAEPTRADDGARTAAAPRRENPVAVMYGCDPAGADIGVAVTHRNMERFVLGRHARQAGCGATLWHTPLSSDALPLEVWAPLLNGGRVVLAPPGELDIDTLARVRAAHDITAVWLPLGLFSAIAAEHPEALAGLDEVWTGGDRVPAAALRRVRAACPALTITIAHGPTEATGFTACHPPAEEAPTLPENAIGLPTENSTLYVLGPGLAPVPAGVTGELYVGGSGVARGYPGRPRLTSQRFVPCPFGPPGGVMYRTGERARWSTDGLLEHVGRAGAQAVVRGVRVELADADEVLCGHPGLAQAVVTSDTDAAGQPRLVGYVVPAAGGTGDGPGDEELRRFAAGRLPESLVPTAFVTLERLPLTPGGRVDRTSLPAPDVRDETYRAPRDHTERVLAQAFAAVLDLDRVGIDDDFFDLGGNSLRAIRLVGQVRAELNLELSIRTLFAARTIIGLTDLLQDLGTSSRPALRKRTRGGEVL